MITIKSARLFSKELQAALIRFGKAHARNQTPNRQMVKLPSGEMFSGETTVPKSIGEDYENARAALLEFRTEWPPVVRIDYTTRGKEIASALRNATQDELEEEYGAALRDIKQLENKIAQIGLKLATEK